MTVPISELKDLFLQLLLEENTQKRGYLFEVWLHELFKWSGLKPRKSFRNIGEQIDGSLILGSETYLVEARWRQDSADLKDLLVLHGKVQAKTKSTRGLFVSIAGFTEDARKAYPVGRPTALIGMDREDIYAIIERKVGLIELLKAKKRRADESSDGFVSAKDLFPERFLEKAPFSAQFTPQIGSPFTIVSALDLLEGDPLREFHVWWDRVTEEDVTEFAAAISRCSENELCDYVVEHRHLLIEHLRGGHGRYVIPGAELTVAPSVDFLISENSTMGHEWFVVELENPQLDFARESHEAALASAVSRIRRWRRWLKRNIDFARRPKEHSGLGLTDIEIDTPGLVLIGRQGSEQYKWSDKTTNTLPRGVDVHTYDWLLKNLAAKAGNLNWARGFRHEP
ncbi:restriction endonuclease [Archangium violaceum]|uniref:restriction endonuclease n=1 Tax=Archangium violaceum TaxID=83451 RepID=UPI00194F6FA9|nr:restriction endonuclease [Archangium violaceum]QRN95746.1 restriction endonuclease [Archangium violaceum]